MTETVMCTHTKNNPNNSKSFLLEEKINRFAHQLGHADRLITRKLSGGANSPQVSDL